MLSYWSCGLHHLYKIQFFFQRGLTQQKLPTLFLLNVFTALKGTIFYILFDWPSGLEKKMFENKVYMYIVPQQVQTIVWGHFLYIIHKSFVH